MFYTYHGYCNRYTNLIINIHFSAVWLGRIITKYSNAFNENNYCPVYYKEAKISGELIKRIQLGKIGDDRKQKTCKTK
jgi:hypothetical protein